MYNDRYVTFNRLKMPKGGNQKPYIERGQKIQWPKEKGKQCSTKHYTDKIKKT